MSSSTRQNPEDPDEVLEIYSEEISVIHKPYKVCQKDQLGDSATHDDIDLDACSWGDPQSKRSDQRRPIVPGACRENTLGRTCS